MYLEERLPNIIDASMREDALCLHKLWERHVLGLQPATPNVHLKFGGAIADGLAAGRRAFYIERRPREDAEAIGLATLIASWGDFPVAIEEGTRNEKRKTLTRCCAALVAYFDQYPFGMDPFVPVPLMQRDGQTGIECPFALPIPGSEHPSGGPWYYAGRMDQFGTMTAQNVQLAADDKTGTSENQWSKQWDMRGQFIGYVWAARQLGLPAAGALVRGIIIYEHETAFPHAIKMYDPWRIEEWLAGVLEDTERINKAWQRREWHKQHGPSCMAYFKPCEYTELCMSRDEGPWRLGRYRVDRWNPLREGE